MEHKKIKNSFSREVKKEIINLIKRDNEFVAFLNGFIFSNAIMSETEFVLNIRNEYIFEKLVKKFEKKGLKFTPKQSKIKINKKDFQINFENEMNQQPTFFFAGVFVGGGSISDKNSTSYHLELKTNYSEHIKTIIDKLNKYEFEFNVLERNSKFIAYTKKLDNLLDFLSAINAKKSWFSLQNIKINRDMENFSNRLNNIDFSNLKKVTDSAKKQFDNICYIYNNNLMNLFNENQLIAYRIRMENPWISLTDIKNTLEEHHNIYISKSGISHWFRKLDKVAKESQK
ncbi:DNA-binding protein WhiA [Mycoplasma sp. 6243]|uniref:DNA-binding protein WhiA n=1 Tax=Mycoplasma sp. 6243 TaxID=3440865 RepID=UPI003EBEF656